MTQLTCDHLTVHRADKIICTHLNLLIQPGEIWAILGPNGSGKTTLLHTLAGCYPQTAGDICLNEQSLKHLKRKAIAKTIAVLQQTPLFTFAETVAEYCAKGRFPHQHYFGRNNDDDHQIVTDALKIMDLLILANKKITQLSGGEKRRLSIATVIAQTPDIFFLDEPTNHLDIHYQIHTMNHFHTLAKTQSKAVLFSSHDLNLIRKYSTHVLLIYPEGQTLVGESAEILTNDHLSRLFVSPNPSLCYDRERAFALEG